MFTIYSLQKVFSLNLVLYSGGFTFYCSISHSTLYVNGIVKSLVMFLKQNLFLFWGWFWCESFNEGSIVFRVALSFCFFGFSLCFSLFFFCLSVFRFFGAFSCYNFLVWVHLGVKLFSFWFGLPSWQHTIMMVSSFYVYRGFGGYRGCFDSILTHGGCFRKEYISFVYFARMWCSHFSRFCSCVNRALFVSFGKRLRFPQEGSLSSWVAFEGHLFS